MRRLIVAAALLSLAACNRDQQSREDTGVDQNVTAETIGGNDITAIDAATNDSANMAADAELNLVETNLSNEAGTDNEATGAASAANAQ